MKSEYPLERLDIRIVYRGRKYKVKIGKELAINESIINSQLKNHPSNYGFFTMIRVILLRDKDRAEKYLEYVRAKLFDRYSNMVNEFTGKPYTKEMVESKIKLNPNYGKAMNAFINAKFKWGQVDAAVKAYESRERLLQTISSNLRKENL